MLGVPVVGEGASTAASVLPAVAVGSIATGVSGFGGILYNMLGGLAQFAISKIAPQTPPTSAQK